MSQIRDSDPSKWLHNKLGTSNDSWTSGSICSQLNKDVLRNIKDCFPNLQTQVKLKLLLSFFHIPRRLIEEWKTELEEIIEVASLDTELWVSTLAETMKTFPATGSLNTEIADYEEARPIFADLVNDLRKLVNKQCDYNLLPLECQYLNKNALQSVVGVQPPPMKHFNLKKKPKSALLRAELLHKCQEAQSSVKKGVTTVVPLRSRGMPRKVSDNAPLKGIPSRMLSPAVRPLNSTNTPQRPVLARAPTARKDCGIKLIEMADQPLGYAAAKKRKREQQLEEQQKKLELKQQQQQAAAAAAAAANAEATNNNKSPSIKEEAPSNGLNHTTPTTTTPIAIKKEIEINAEANQSDVDMDAQEPQHIKDDLDDAFDAIKSEPASECTVITTTESNHKISKNFDLVPAANANQGSKLNSGEINKPKQRAHRLIEIKSEEIIVPPCTSVEKTEPTEVPQTRIVIQPQIVQRQQRVIVQQPAKQAQQIPMRSAPLKRTAGQSTVGTLTSTMSTPIKIEKLEIKTEPESPTKLNLSHVKTLSQQQLRQTVSPLKNLPNNISVKITPTRPHATQTQAQIQRQNATSSTNITTQVILPTQTARTIAVASTKSTSVQAQTIKAMPINQLKSATNTTPLIISQTIIKPAPKRTQEQLVSASSVTATQPGQRLVQHAQLQSKPQIQTHQQSQPQHQQQITQTQYIISPTKQQPRQLNVPTLTSFAHSSPAGTRFYQTSTSASVQTPTKILLKTSPTGVVMTPLRGQPQTGILSNNPPPLIPTSSVVIQQTPARQNQVIGIQTSQLPNRPVTIQPASQAAQQQHLQAQLQQQQQQQPQQQHTIVSNTTAAQQPKLQQLIVQPVTGSMGNASNALNKNKTIYVAQKGVIIRGIGGEVCGQLPISSVGGLQSLNAGNTFVTTTMAGPPSLVKTTPAIGQTHTIQIQQQPNKHLIPNLITANNISGGQHFIVRQPAPPTLVGNTTQQSILRPVITSNVGNSLPQGLTLIQRPGQQPQLVQRVITTAAAAPQQIILQKAAQQRIISTSNAGTNTTTQDAKVHVQGQLKVQLKVAQPVQQQQQQQIQHQKPSQQQQQLIKQQQPQNKGNQQQQQTIQRAPQRKGLSLSNEHVHEAHEMFKRANRVSRPDKALILGFMAGMRENPRPSSDNTVVIKLGDSEEKMKKDDGSTALCLMESYIRLDYNTGDWSTFQNYKLLDEKATS